MSYLKVVSASHRRSGYEVPKGEVPDAWRRIRAMLEEPSRRLVPYSRYNSEGIAAELKEAEQELWGFWFEERSPCAIVEKRRNIFEKPYSWSPSYHWAAIADFNENNFGRGKPFWPTEELMQLFVLLSEPFNTVGRSQIRLAYDKIGWSSGISQIQLIRMLNRNALDDLLVSINGEHVAELIVNACECDIRDCNAGLVEKIVRTFSVLGRTDPELNLYKVDKLGDHVVLRASGSVIAALRHTESKLAHAVVDYLVKRLESARRDIDEVLVALKGAQNTESKTENTEH